MNQKVKYQISIFLFTIITGVTFCQNNACNNSEIFIRSFLIEEDLCKNLQDFKSLFPPETIKAQQLSELKFKVHSKDLKWSKTEIPFHFCFDLVFKFKKEFVTQVIYKNLENFEITYNLSWSKKTEKLRSREKIVKKPNSQKEEKGLEKYFYTKNGLLSKTEFWSIDSETFKDSLYEVKNYQYDKSEQEIFRSGINTKLSSETTFEPQSKKSISKNYYEEKYLGKSIKEYDDRMNLISNESINNENRTSSYETFYYSNSNQLLTSKHINIDKYGYVYSEVEFQFLYSKNGLLDGMNFISDNTRWRLILDK